MKTGSESAAKPSENAAEPSESAVKKPSPSTQIILDLCERGYVERGDGLCVLQAVDHCFATGTEVPFRARQAFCGRYLPWVRFQFQTLDEAFGVTLPERFHFDERRTREQLRPLVVLRVLQLNQEGEAIGGALFDRVGKELGISESTCRTIFYEAESEPLRKLLQNASIS